MNDRLKFRFVGRNKHFNEIVISEDLTANDLLTGNFPSFFSLSNRLPDGNCEFIAQSMCTCLKDKNGNLIFDGDIVSVDYCTINSEGDEVLGTIISEVIFCDESAQYCINPQNGMIIEITYPETVEVIGNIYENPELIK